MKFKTSIGLTALLAILAGVFSGLGTWQLGRAEEKRAAQGAFDQASEVTALAPGLPAWTRVRLQGELDPERHFLLDNKLFQGRPGVHALTPLTTADGDVVLVNRGWLPLPADRSALPAVPTPAETVTIAGRLAPLSRPGVVLGEPVELSADTWPQLLVYPDWRRLERALDLRLHRQVLYLDADAPAGFGDRAWSPFTMGPDRHQAYAVQWFGLALAAVATWAVLGFNAGRKDGA